MRNFSLARKQFADRFVGGIFLIVLAPALFMVGLLIHLTAGGAIVVTDEYLNVDGAVTRHLRFRTTGPGTHLFREMGRVLRTYSLDELPGFWNVARGEVGLGEFFRLSRRK
jgi:lipopolysaccharide/colanic/teichoic acid biosynthesis glycosyltransferase